MHSARLLLRRKTTFSKYLKYHECRESSITSGDIGHKYRSDSYTVRLFCSSNSKDDEGNPDIKSKNGSVGEKGTSAKEKLDMLLKSIVQQNKEAVERKAQEGDKVIDMKLAAPIRQKSAPSQEKDRKTAEDLDAEKDLGKEMVKAVKDVAEAVEGDSKTVESELVQKLKTSVGKKINMTDLFAGMKIDRTKATSATSSTDIDLSRAHRVRRVLNDRSLEPRKDASRKDMGSRPRRAPPSSKQAYVPIDLFGSTPLGIFSSSDTKETSPAKPKQAPILETWDALHKRDLKLAVTHPPANGFEEMILWTEQGKLWRFPINNEQDLEDEAKVPFHEHVFLEPQIEDWCPKKGPIRHFMELVCIGLSKNPFLTVKEKHKQIEWYHQYFKEKSAIIKEVGAGEIK